MKTGVLLINLGTPNSPKPKDVFHYLNEFLTDRRVIDIPFLKRQLLVRGIIVPSRYKLSAKSYKTIWQEEGGPLNIHSKALNLKLQETLGEDFIVDIAMRYQNPSIEQALKTLEETPISELIIIPLFPQYASATTGSICEKIFSFLSKWTVIPKTRIINHFFDHPTMIQAFCQIAKDSCYESYDHILMSFHGLPEDHLKKADHSDHCLKSKDCCKLLCNKNALCYGAQCHATAYAITKTLSLSKESYTICFQSRLGKKPWLSPFTSTTIKTLAQKGFKKILVMCPAFVCDCLETLHEIAIEYNEEFQKCGGESLDLMPGLNTHPLWVQTLKELVLEQKPSYHGCLKKQ